MKSPKLVSNLLKAYYQEAFVAIGYSGGKICLNWLYACILHSGQHIVSDTSLFMCKICVPPMQDRAMVPHGSACQWAQLIHLDQALCAQPSYFHILAYLDFYYNIFYFLCWMF